MSLSLSITLHPTQPQPPKPRTFPTHYITQAVSFKPLCSTTLYSSLTLVTAAIVPSVDPLPLYWKKVEGPLCSAFGWTRDEGQWAQLFFLSTRQSAWLRIKFVTSQQTRYTRWWALSRSRCSSPHPLAHHISKYRPNLLQCICWFFFFFFKARGKQVNRKFSPQIKISCPICPPLSPHIIFFFWMALVL